jgi:hypothetical protein
MESTEEQTATAAPPISRSRLVVGAALFVGGFLSPLLIPLVTRSDLPAGWKAFLSTGLVAGVPEVGMILAAGVLGKDGFAWLKQKLLAVLRRHTEPAAVSRTRYRIGLVLFGVPLVTAWLHPYLAHFLPALVPPKLLVLPAILMDLAFAISFLVLGAGFWEKVRRLFVYDAQ